MTDQPDWAAPGRPPPGSGGSSPDPAGPRPPAWVPPPPSWGQPAAAKPGVIPLRPLGVGEILDGAVSYIRANPVVTLGLSAVVITLTQLIEVPAANYLLSGLSSALGTSPENADAADLAEVLGASTGGWLLSSLVTSIAVTVLTGLLVVVLGEAVLGRRMSIGVAWAATRGRVLGLLGLSLLTSLVVSMVLSVGVIAAVVGAVATPDGTGGLIGLLTVPLAIMVAIYLGVSWSMITPVYVIERAPALATFGRSWRLVRHQWWRIFGILLLSTLITIIFAAVVAVPFGGLASAVDGTDATPGLLGSVINAFAAILATTITAPFSAGVTGLLYFDQRIRREAFDIELARAAQVPTDQYPPGQYPPAEPPRV